MSVVRRVPEDVMTWRARAYLVITGLLQNGLTGLACLWLQDTDAFDGDGWRVVREIMPMWKWGIGFLVFAGLLMIAAARGSELLARIGMPLSAVLTGLWAAAFVLAFHDGGVVSPVGAIIASSLCAKDLLICSQPLRLPFEPLVKEYVGPRGA